MDVWPDTLAAHHRQAAVARPALVLAGTPGRDLVTPESPQKNIKPLRHWFYWADLLGCQQDALVHDGPRF